MCSLALAGSWGCVSTEASSVGGLEPSCQGCFETKEFDWSGYSVQLQRVVSANWHIPELARKGFKGLVTVRFVIRRNGEVEGVELLSHSSIPAYDSAAIAAVRGPLPPLPAEFSGDREQVTLTFFYNTRPSQKARDR